MTSRRSSTTMWIAGILGCAGVTVAALCLVVAAGGLLFLRAESPAARRERTGRPTRTPAVVSRVTPQVTNPNPALPSPTPACGQPVLTVGTTSYRIESLDRATDGSVPVPPDTPDVAYWVAETTTNYVFGLSPTASNLALPAWLPPGAEVTIAWDDCRVVPYVLQAIVPGRPDASTFDQSAAGITIFIPAGPAGEGYIMRGGQVEAEVVVTATPLPAGATQPEGEAITPAVPSPPDAGQPEGEPIATATPLPAGAIQREAEISFLEKTDSANGTTLGVTISIFNYGASAFTVSPGDVSLTLANAAPQAPVRTDPALPLEVGPGATQVIRFTFPQPASADAVFKLFEVEFNLADF